MTLLFKCKKHAPTVSYKATGRTLKELHVLMDLIEYMYFLVKARL